MAKQTETPTADMTINGLFPIRTVAALTGMNPITLRAWERRYHLITPQRTPKGHRLYTQSDIDRIHQIIKLLDQGISIGQVAPLLEQQDGATPTTRSAANSDVWSGYQHRMLTSIMEFNERSLDAIYNDALSLYPLDLVNNQLISPVLRQLGEQWREREDGIAEEHFFSVYLRNKLGARIHHLNLRNNGPLILASCLPGELHDMGLLFFVLAAVSSNCRVIILGANLPLDQLPTVQQKQPCQAIVLSGSAKPSRKLFDEELPKLIGLSGVPIFVGGAICDKHEDAIEKTGCISVGRAIQPGLEKIIQTLKQG